MRHPLLVKGRPNLARQSLASTLSAPRVAATSYCDPGRHANVITPCLLTPCLNVPNQCSFVYPYPIFLPSAGGNSDHGPRKTRTKSQTTPDSGFIGESRNSDHSLSFRGGKTQTMVRVWGVLGVGADDGGSHCLRVRLHAADVPLALFQE